MYPKPKRPKANWTMVPGAKVNKPREKKRVRQKSSNQARRERQYRPIAVQYKREHPLCEICVKETVSNGVPRPIFQTSDIHHRRGKLKDLLCDVRFFTAVCRMHHNKIDQDRAWAYREGWLEHGWNHTPKNG